MGHDHPFGLARGAAGITHPGDVIEAREVGENLGLSRVCQGWQAGTKFSVTKSKHLKLVRCAALQLQPALGEVGNVHHQHFDLGIFQDEQLILEGAHRVKRCVAHAVSQYRGHSGKRINSVGGQLSNTITRLESGVSQDTGHTPDTLLKFGIGEAYPARIDNRIALWPTAQPL